MTALHDAWMHGARHLADAGIDSARLDARVLLARAMDIAPENLLTADAPTPAQLRQYGELIARRAAREPLAYVVGRKEFWGLSFGVGPGVLIPRPETETLLEQAFNAFGDPEQPLNVLDLGTGSGCLLIAFLKYRPRARGLGIDRSSAALAWARGNAESLDVASRSTWYCGDWSSVDIGTYDVIFSNPPYLAKTEKGVLAPEIAQHEPAEALFSGEDGLEAYRALARLIARSLKPSGKTFLEIGLGQGDAVGEILGGHGLEILGVAPDLAGIPRCIAARRPPVISWRGAEKTVGNLRSSR